MTSSAIFVFDIDGRVVVYDDLDENDLCRRLSRAHGPRHLADRPIDYANEVLRH
jgi:hypothetical protein